MGTGFNQIVTVSGGPGVTSVQHIDYNPITHTLTLVKANGTTTPVVLKDSHVESIALNGNIMEFHIGDTTHGLLDTVVSLDITAFKNPLFATQPEMDGGIVTNKVVNPALIKQWLSNVVVAGNPTPQNAGKLVPLSADGKIDAKWLHHLAITDVHVAGDKAALDLLVAGATVGKGDVGIATAESKSYIFDGGSWLELLTPTDAVLSVNGKTGAVIIDTDEIPETISNMFLKPGNADGDVMHWDAITKKWTAATAHSLEIGGKAFKPNAAYEAGDIVDNGNHIYTRITAGGEATWDLTKWQLADSSGRLHSDASRYLVGDIVSYGNELYVNTAAITTPKPWDPLDWTLASGGTALAPIPEVGGIAYGAATVYKVGDVVSDLGIAYIATAASTGSVPAVTPASWKIVGTEERAGMLWNTATQYKERDVVSMPSTDKLYIAMRDNVGSSPLGFIDWFELHSIRYDAGNFTPTIGTEMPDTTSESEGALWYVDGLTAAGYTFTTGPFIGRTAQNNDKIVWYGTDSSGADIWLLEPFPLLHGEVGGLAFNSSFHYPQGALTTDAGDTYVSLTDVPAGGTIPSATPGSWKLASGSPEIGGVAYDVNADYLVDDIVAVGQHIFISNIASKGKVPGVDPEWTALSLAEKGGLVWNATVHYSAGDIVSNGGVIYAAVTPSIGDTPPSTNWATPSVAELGGRLWGSGVGYAIGDIVTDNLDGNVYSASAASIGSQPSITPSTWTVTGKQEPEVGGRIYDTTKNYLIGDIVTNAGKLFVCVSNSTGAFTPADWKPEEEIGGVIYDISVTYNEGDIVSDDQGIPKKVWISLQGNNSNNPLLRGQWWQELDTIFYWVGPYTPTAIAEYPDETAERIGGIWEVSGLGIDAQGDPIGYTFTTGRLTGIKVVDGDHIIWADGAVGSVVWLLEKYPRINGEQGGVLYSSGRSYRIGDIVTYSGIVYMAIQASTGSQPDTGITDWVFIVSDPGTF